MTQRETDIVTQDPDVKDLALEDERHEEHVLWLQRYLDNALEPADRAACAARLQVDARARRHLERLRRAQGALRQHIESLAQNTLDSTGLFARITDALDGEQLPGAKHDGVERAGAVRRLNAVSEVPVLRDAVTASARTVPTATRSARLPKSRVRGTDAGRQGGLRVLSAKGVGRVIVLAPMLAAAAALMLWIWSGESATDVLASSGGKRSSGRGDAAAPSFDGTRAAASGGTQGHIQVLRGADGAAFGALDSATPAVGLGWVNGGTASPHTEVLEVDFGSHGGTIYSGADDTGRATIVWIEDRAGR